jgi:hypothetical protein
MPKWRSKPMRSDVLREADDATKSRNEFDFFKGGYSRCLTEICASPTIVTFKADNIAMAIVRVESGRNVVWRVRLPDLRLNSTAFANAERAMRWIANGQTLYPSEDEEAEKVSRPASSTTPIGSVEPIDKKTEPKWEKLEWQRRYDPIWRPGKSFSSKHANGS